MNDRTKYQIMKEREFLKGYHSGDAGAEKTDQEQKLPSIPSLKKRRSQQTIALPVEFDRLGISSDIWDLIMRRQSRRRYAPEAVSLYELSFLLWATQGIRKFAGHKEQVTFRSVPSAGSRHPLETYLFANHVAGLSRGLYHYLPGEHVLELWDPAQDYEAELTRALCGQHFAATAPVLFVWSALPYRTEWRYGLKASKYILLDAGHMCQNLYLACESIGCGACAIGAYDQDHMDELLGFAPGPSVDPQYECVVYAAAVGRVREGQ